MSVHLHPTIACDGPDRPEDPDRRPCPYREQHHRPDLTADDLVAQLVQVYGWSHTVGGGHPDQHRCALCTRRIAKSSPRKDNTS